MTTDGVSVVIPTWNRSDTIIAAVSSALDQSVPPVEVLVCDDGSADDTETRIRAVADTRVRWICGLHTGSPSAPRNRGMREARGEWLAFLDSDDVWMPEKLARQLHVAHATGLDAVCTDARRWIPGVEPKDRLLGGADEVLDFAQLLRRNRVVCSSVLIRRSVCLRAGGFPEAPKLRAAEDYALWLRVATATNFAYIGEPLLNYRDEPSTSIRSDSLNAWTERIVVVSDLLDWISQQGQHQSAVAERLAKRSLTIAKFRRPLSFAYHAFVSQ